MAAPIQRVIPCIVILVSLLATPATAGADDFETALSAYERQDYAAAYPAFQALAETGNAAAQFKLGVMYANGRGVVKHDAEAIRWSRMAAEQGHANAARRVEELSVDSSAIRK